MDRIRGPGRIDDRTAIGLAPGDIEKTGSQALMERDIHSLVAVLGVISPAGALNPVGNRNVENEGQVRAEIAKNHTV